MSRFLCIAAILFILVPNSVLAQKAGEMQYTDGSGYEYYNTEDKDWRVFTVIDGSGDACDDALPGAWRYNDEKVVFEYCDGDAWKEITGTGNGNGCSKAGELEFDATDQAYWMCDADEYHTLDSSSATDG